VDATVRVGVDATVRVGVDATVRVGVDATVRVGAEATVRVGVDATVRVGADVTVRGELLTAAADEPDGMYVEPVLAPPDVVLVPPPSVALGTSLSDD
jgi:hypothetical protein